ncbi:MAG TPA: MBOAT family O-acyltransferase [Polyangiaceae bacterium]|nr:MBOAT family O-acyltransferase [Polyangiaceae bacterium]
MSFASVPFAVFFAAVWVAVRLRGDRENTSLLLFASLLFYALWAPSALLVLGFLLASNYALARNMERSPRPRGWLVASVVLTLGTLATFKYAQVAVPFAARFVPALRPLATDVEWLAVPIGISFYAFEMVSVAVDVHARRLPCPPFSRYALFVTFFPHLVAGPILRGGELVPQFETGGARTPLRNRRGLWLVMSGLLKKVVLSDYLLQPIVKETFAAPGAASGPVHLVAMYSFAFQIYADFSGYSDLARGLSCLLGYELPMNFEEPYLSRDPAEFWRRWHMTLSRWLRDYLYVPLGGNRHGPARTYLNLFLTMAIGGLWHGAGLNFLVWGALHGVFLVAHRASGAARNDEKRPLAWSDLPRVVLTFHLVCLAWIPFRAPTWSAAVDFFRGLSKVSSYASAWPPFPALVVALAVATHFAERALRPRLPAFHVRLASASWGAAVDGALLGATVALAVLASGAGTQFIYFQF